MIKANVIQLEWKLGRRGFATAAVVVLSFLAMFAGVADMYTGNEELMKLVESYPPALLAAVGIDPAALTTFEGWMSTQPYTFYTLLMGVFGSMWAAASIAKERDRGTAEWLFSLPYGRAQIYFSKAAAHGLQVTAVYALGVAATLGVGYAAADVNEPGKVALLLTGGYLTALAFSGLGFALTALLRSERSAMGAAAGIVVVSFLLNMLDGLQGGIRRLAQLSLFQAFDSGDILAEGVLTPLGVGTTLGIYIVGLLVGWAVLRRQDV
ncbi:ABC transporter permease subunit [Paenibacillus sp.]|uniref:ABC transporter permease subunit n=1 Tax=Paenibacillus sp. TaxID=58172 RepID=UPI002D5C05F2|nr:ABC transporter permease subunit [Paenibacillus sp.]HZG85173.1 ABC transporter permease subunit [Paenibacillus sp.]